MNAFILKGIIAQIVNFYNNLFFVFFWGSRCAHQWSGGYQENVLQWKAVHWGKWNIYIIIHMLEKDMLFLIEDILNVFLKV